MDRRILGRGAKAIGRWSGRLAAGVFRKLERRVERRLRRLATKLEQRRRRQADRLRTFARRVARDRGRASHPAGPTNGAVPHADERTIRRTAETEHGGISSQESRQRYERGENPGGTHKRAAHFDEVRPHPRPDDEEPQPREDRTLGGPNHLPDTRRGS